MKRPHINPRGAVWVLVAWAFMTCPAAATAPALSLAEAVEQALASHPALLAAEAAWHAAQEAARGLAMPPDPVLGYEVEGLPSIFNVGGFEERSIGLTQRVGLPFAWRHNVQAAGLRADAEGLEGFASARLELGFEVAVAYLDVQLEERLLVLSVRDRDLARDLADATRRRHELGDIARLAMLRAGVEAQRAEIAAAQHGDALRSSRARLNAILSRPVGADIELADSLAVHETDLDELGLQAMAFRHRPELMAAARQHEVARLQGRAARAELFPSLVVGLFRHDFDPATAPATWRLNLGVEVPLWGASRQRADLARAAAETRRRELLEEDLRNRISLDVHTAWLRLQSARSSLQLFDSLLPAVEEAYTVGRRSWEQGKASYVEVLDARSGLTEQHMAHVRAVYAHEFARHNLERAVGGTTPQPGVEN